MVIYQASTLIRINTWLSSYAVHNGRLINVAIFSKFNNWHSNQYLVRLLYQIHPLLQRKRHHTVNNISTEEQLDKMTPKVEQILFWRHLMQCNYLKSEHYYSRLPVEVSEIVIYWIRLSLLLSHVNGCVHARDWMMSELS